MRKYKITIEGEYGDARFANTKITYDNISPIGAGYVVSEIKSKIYNDIINMEIDSEHLRVNNFSNLIKPIHNENKKRKVEAAAKSLR